MLRIQLIKPRKEGQKGFTIVELVLVIVLLGVLLPMFAVVLVSMYRESFFLGDKVNNNAETLQALWYMEDSVRSAAAFKATVPGAFTDNYGPNNLGTSGGEAWSYKGTSSTSRVLITQNYATTVNALNTGRQPVFIDDPGFDCTTQLYYQPQLTFITIYFVKDSVLYKRILNDTTTTLCPGNAQAQKKTCPPYIATGSWHVSCQAADEILAKNVTKFDVSYYQLSTAGVSTQIDPTYASTDPDILVGVDYATVTITTSTKGGAVTNTMTQRMTKINQ